MYAHHKARESWQRDSHDMRFKRLQHLLQKSNIYSKFLLTKMEQQQKEVRYVWTPHIRQYLCCFCDGRYVKFSKRPPSAQQSAIADVFTQVCTIMFSGWGIHHSADYSTLIPRDAWLFWLFLLLSIAYVFLCTNYYLFYLNTFPFTLPPDISSL